MSLPEKIVVGVGVLVVDAVDVILVEVVVFSEVDVASEIRNIRF